MITELRVSFDSRTQHEAKEQKQRREKKMERRKTGRKKEDRNKEYSFLHTCQNLMLVPIQQLLLPDDSSSSARYLDLSENLSVGRSGASG